MSEPGLFKVKIAEETEEKKLGVDNLGLEMNEVSNFSVIYTAS